MTTKVLKRYEPNCEARMTECPDGEHFLVNDVVKMVEDMRDETTGLAAILVTAGDHRRALVATGIVGSMVTLLEQLRPTTTRTDEDEDEGDNNDDDA